MIKTISDFFFLLNYCTGMWFMHCHLDVHLPWGLGMVFEVENGPTPWVLPPPPADLPKC